MYSLRATQAYSVAKQASGGLLVYLQLSLAQGYITIAQDTVPLLRVLLVHATNPPDTIEPRHEDDVGEPADPTDKPRTRFWVRRMTNILNLGFLAATIPNAIQGSKYKDALHDQSAADKLMRFRYVFRAS